MNHKILGPASGSVGPTAVLSGMIAALGVSLALLLTLGTTACSDSKSAGANVLLIVVDTLRADRLGCYGNESGMTPRMDTLAAEGVLFKKAYSHAPWTLASFASLLTSTYPVQHKAGGWVGEFTKLRSHAETVGECFQAAGSRTVSIVNVDFLTEHFGMHKGFDRVDHEVGHNNHLTRTAARTTDCALRWLDGNGGEPFFMMVHYFDPHLVYEPPADFRARFALGGDKETTDTIFGEVKDIIAFRQGRLPLDAPKIRRLEGLHNGEVAFTDRELGRLLDGLAQRGLDKKTIVVLTSDHGEEFHDHGGFEHGHTLYDELLHVPLIVRWPGHLPAGTEVDATVRLVDVAPTVCRLAGVEGRDGFQGLDLSPLWQPGAEAEDRPVFSEGYFWSPEDRFARIADGKKTIAYSASKRVEIYDLEKDPLEKIDLAKKDKALAERLMKDLFLSRTGLEIDAGAAEPARLTDEMRERIKQLGYTR